MWPVTFYKRIPSVPPLSEVEAQLASMNCAGVSPAQFIPSRSLSRRAKTHKDVSAGCSRVELSLMQDVTSEEAGRGNMGKDSVGAQHVGTGMGLGGRKGISVQGNNRELAARSKVAVVKVIANATANRS
jgi:hypothetical protein